MIKFHELPEHIEIGSYKNKKMVITNKEGGYLRTQAPRLYMPFGICGFTPEVGPTKYTLDLSLTGYDEEGGYVEKFYNTLRKVEDMVVDAVVAQSEQIFDKPMTKEELLPMFNSNIKENPGHPPKFRVKVDTDMNNVMKAEVFDANRERIVKGELTNGLYSRNSGRPIVEMCSVYFLNRKFGVTWKLHQLQVFEPERLKGFQFTI
jgi:hypothetical protein